MSRSKIKKIFKKFLWLVNAKISFGPCILLRKFTRLEVDRLSADRYQLIGRSIGGDDDNSHVKKRAK